MSAGEHVTRDGFRWLVLAGGAAVLLSIFLYRVDLYLTNSKAEQQLGETLREIRSAQAEVSPGVSDHRQLDKISAPSIAVTTTVDAHSTEAIEAEGEGVESH